VTEDGSERTQIPAVCSIGMIDPWNAAGLGLDILVLAECGVRPVTVVAGVAPQAGAGLRAPIIIDPAAIRAQWDCLAGAGIAAIRIGALPGVAAVDAVADIVAAARVPAVYDPVLGASRGGRFADAATVAAIRERLLPIVAICTPNSAEASELAATAGVGTEGMVLAAHALVALGARAVLVTGGDVAGDPRDVLVDGGRETILRAPRIAGTMRGSGCVLAGALAAGLARGLPLRAAVDDARAFVRKKIAGARAAGDFRVAY
jgi:hydroxymethylpyrimidine/phosphomethylpyrimidine kinase